MKHHTTAIKLTLTAAQREALRALSDEQLTRLEQALSSPNVDEVPSDLSPEARAQISARAYELSLVDSTSDTATLRARATEEFARGLLDQPEPASSISRRIKLLLDADDTDTDTDTELTTSRRRRRHRRGGGGVERYVPRDRRAPPIGPTTTEPSHARKPVPSKPSTFCSKLFGASTDRHWIGGDIPEQSW
jgi:hypothetical protein